MFVKPLFNIIESKCEIGFYGSPIIGGFYGWAKTKQSFMQVQNVNIIFIRNLHYHYYYYF